MLFFSRKRGRLEAIYDMIKEIHDFLHKYQVIDVNKDKKAGDYIDGKFYLGEIVKCEKCKCLLYKSDAVEGKPEIKERIKVDSYDAWLTTKKEQYIYHPYYCPRCWEEIKKKRRARDDKI